TWARRIAWPFSYQPFISIAVPSVGRRHERVAGIRISARQSPPEPFHALRRRAVCEALWHHTSGRHALQTVVTDRGRRAQTGFDIALFELDLSLRRTAGLGRLVTPDAGEAVGLKLE